jgi:hypothetical protein
MYHVHGEGYYFNQEFGTNIKKICLRKDQEKGRGGGEKGGAMM